MKSNFYSYDTSVDEFCTKENVSYLPFTGSKTLVFIKVLQRYVRHQLWYDYYFHDENNFKYFIPISKDNTFRSLLMIIITGQDHLQCSAKNGNLYVDVIRFGYLIQLNNLLYFP